jgi:hypothetical protein
VDVVDELNETVRDRWSSGALRWPVSGEGEQVRALVLVQLERRTERFSNLRGWSGVACLFQAGQVVDADPGKGGDFFTA